MLRKLLFLLPLLALLLTACGDDTPITPAPAPEPGGGDEPSGGQTEWVTVTPRPDEWDGQRRAGITYQLLVYSFADSDGDGTGDLPGLTARLDYLDRMGISALWLSPIHPAMSYHGYDVTDYTAVNPRLGTMADFDRLLQEAHARGIKVYLDFVLNHTGKDHPWFQSAKADADSPYRQFYTFSRDPEADIAAGQVPMIATEGAAGYQAGEWFNATGTASEVSGRFRFRLDWSDPKAPTVTVDEWDGPADDTSGIDPGREPRYLYYGDALCLPFRPLGEGRYELIVDFASQWGFLIRTSTTSWDGGTKWGAPSASDKLTPGQPFTLDSGTAADILFADQALWKYHSAFRTDWFADLNYGPATQCDQSPAYQAVADAAGGWIQRGADGFRLDAVKHIYHNATTDENPTFLRTFYDDMNARYHAAGHADSDIYMVGEVLSEHGEVAPYYAGLPALFEFSFWYRLEYAINNGMGRYFAKDIMGYRDEYQAVRPDYIAATKLTNHDEDRAASLLSASADKCRLAAAVLLTASGTPYIYYGEELGVTGTKQQGDENVRQPMPWTDVDAQEADPHSLLSAYRTLIELRNTYPALATGRMERHPVYNDANAAYNQLSAWYMADDASGQRLLVLHNFGPSATDLPLTDAVQRPLAALGTVQQSTASDGTTQLRLGGYSSVVYLLE